LNALESSTRTEFGQKLRSNTVSLEEEQSVQYLLSQNYSLLPSDKSTKKMEGGQYCNSLDDTHRELTRERIKE